MCFLHGPLDLEREGGALPATPQLVGPGGVYTYLRSELNLICVYIYFIYLISMSVYLSPSM